MSRDIARNSVEAPIWVRGPPMTSELPPSMHKGQYFTFFDELNQYHFPGILGRIQSIFDMSQVSFTSQSRLDRLKYTSLMVFLSTMELNNSVGGWVSSVVCPQI